jgi:hypothetical protein
MSSLGKVALYVLPSEPIVVILVWQLDVEPIPAEATLLSEHENRLEPLLSIYHVVYEAASVIALVEEDGGDWICGNDGLNKAPAIEPGPNGLTLKAWLQIDLPVAEHET